MNKIGTHRWAENVARIWMQIAYIGHQADF